MTGTRAGGASRMIGRLPVSGGITRRFNCRMMGTAIGSPTFSVPWANSTPPILPDAGESRPSPFDSSRHVQHLVDRLCGAIERATPAAVAQFGENEHLFPDDGDGVVLAYPGAAPAGRAFAEIHLRDELAHLAALRDGGAQEQRRVRLLHVAVQEERTLLGQAERQADRNGRLTRSALAACYGDDHDNSYILIRLANDGVSDDRARRRLLVLLYTSAAHLQEATCPSPMATSASGPPPGPAPRRRGSTAPCRRRQPPRLPSPPMGRAGRRWGAAVPAPGSTRREPAAGWRLPDRRSRRRRSRRTTPRQCGPCRPSKVLAPTGQASTHAPQPVQQCVSIHIVCLSAIVLSPAGARLYHDHHLCSAEKGLTQLSQGNFNQHQYSVWQSCGYITHGYR